MSHYYLEPAGEFLWLVFVLRDIYQITCSDAIDTNFQKAPDLNPKTRIFGPPLHGLVVLRKTGAKHIRAPESKSKTRILIQEPLYDRTKAFFSARLLVFLIQYLFKLLPQTLS